MEKRKSCKYSHIPRKVSNVKGAVGVRPDASSAGVPAAPLAKVHVQVGAPARVVADAVSHTLHVVAVVGIAVSPRRRTAPVRLVTGPVALVSASVTGPPFSEAVPPILKPISDISIPHVRIPLVSMCAVAHVVVNPA